MQHRIYFSQSDILPELLLACINCQDCVMQRDSTSSNINMQDGKNSPNCRSKPCVAAADHLPIDTPIGTVGATEILRTPLPEKLVPPPASTYQMQHVDWTMRKAPADLASPQLPSLSSPVTVSFLCPSCTAMALE